ncbi:MAG: TFIIB-type zinc ribbon-containing protein [Desulfurivibrionaceae bacterium]|jgi:hypothetical protein|nr:zf-TFIIB domain-containing protein [Desulfobulbaceae bacterium]MDP2002590.1 zf-TFIIB domain-containing protein [Desulfurivibrionaceae bacterium]MDP2758104.1 zf-TFIIB domain-containing protein [Desulfurivibrionaceae bacterium]PKN23221.1 MAG: hypothetical protein CVU68_01905 [Deltaproteobacteria bacterium HGW-Deltaproteobacteria-3]
MKCPVCTQVDLMMTDRQGVEIDYCPQCRGIWLDRGELDKIIERTAAPASHPPQAAPQPQGGYDQHGHGYHKKQKHKSLLGELFDF